MYFFFNCGIKNLENMSLICPFHPCFQPAGQPLIPHMPRYVTYSFCPALLLS